ncbi:hypothetical protein NQ176_g10064 [Zarea fungicola]|uniref:Uncharacterized protein n=1 Tax=Zarea fungicola TaxID=93591 RepID=A0ACC1MIR7_9HYPO|nr:hypothetical protein NQ176_g10064 [Lecanicillium fungicola]
MRFQFSVCAALAFAATGVLGRNVVGYFPSWKKQYADAMNLGLYTHINFAFAIPAPDGSFSFDGDWFLPAEVTALHAKGVKALISIGGWTGSNYFSTILKSTSTSNSMVTNIINYIKTNNLDGVDLDWEYPGRLGDNCNAFDPKNDAANYLKFLQSLRTKLDSTFGAVSSAPGIGDRRRYLLPPAGRRLAHRALSRDMQEGADMLMVKPAYCDIIRDARNMANVPIVAMQVSGEYALIQAGAQAGVVGLREMAFESTEGIFRADADVVVSYFTPYFLDWLS